MGADFFFRMGDTHAICQDYGVAGVENGVEYAIVSDGCSGITTGAPGSPFTDFGARFLVRAAQRRADRLAEGFACEDAILTEAAAAATLLNLPAPSLDATLLVAARQLGGSDAVRIWCMGDGVVVTRDRDGSLRYRSVEYGGNMPHYLSYGLDWKREHAYVMAAQTMTVTVGFADGRQHRWGSAQDERPIEVGPRDSVAYDANRIDLVLLFTDGVKSFTDRDGRPVPLEAVLEEVLALKNFQGQFLGRRCNRFFRSTCLERGWKHADDFAVAGIYIGAPS